MELLLHDRRRFRRREDGSASVAPPAHIEIIRV
ncbi:hypothetical protein FHT76_003562 [Rhizobium sp. BK176]|nr:hypothetical protein [Rhizobium sp. BK399]MCS3740154.1 hypothetical protein [Rhizobium sp. BK661]MCS4091896.1 hypothetical protein [Rhizobium sp. BK176]